MTDRMDDELERLINTLDGPRYDMKSSQVANALRLRFQQLLSEARAEGAQIEKNRILAGLDEMEVQQASREMAADAMGELE